MRPLTLVFGANSGGKSSLLHFLLWINDVIINRHLDVYFPSAAGDAVDLGGFKQMRHGTDAATEVKVRTSLTVKDARKQLSQIEVVASLGTCQPPVDLELHLAPSL